MTSRSQPNTPTRAHYQPVPSPWLDRDGFQRMERVPSDEGREGATPRRRRVKRVWCSRPLLVISLLGTLVVVWTVTVGRSTDAKVRLQHGVHHAVDILHDYVAKEPVRGFNKSLVLNYDEPQDTMVSQLKPGVRYITTLSYGGHANQFMAIENLLYLGKLLNRVVIIPTLTPLHFIETPRDFSQFYDLDRFYHQTQIPAVELSSVKWWNFTAPPKSEPLSCWSILELTAGGRNLNDGSMAVHNVDVKNFPLPNLGRASEGFSIWFEAIHDFDYDWESRRQWLEKVRHELLPQQPPPSKATSVVPLNRHQNLKPGFDPGRNDPPSDQLFCLDTTFFLGSRIFPPAYPPGDSVQLEPLRSYEGHGWISAGQHIHFSAELEQLADVYLADLFGTTIGAELPPFITIHLRRGDFSTARGLTSLDKFTDALKRVRDKLDWRMDHPDGWTGPGKGKEKYYKGVRGKHYAVVATTDEKPGSPFFKQLTDELGWKVIDHEAMATVEQFGNWYPALIDAAVLARGSGFVGTEWSTFSYLAGLRVKYWNGGVEEFTPSLA
ncbi:hypothetical protein JCM8547_006122 [Rhodosporidiobolus lusitaniae]